jgi:hypothetical protein
MNWPSWANAQECSVTRWGLRSRFADLVRFRLEPGPQVPGPVPLPVQVLPGMPAPVTGGRDVHDPQVNAEEPVRLGEFSRGDVAGGV